MSQPKPHTTEQLMQWIEAHAHFGESSMGMKSSCGEVSTNSLRELFAGMMLVPATAQSAGPVAYRWRWPNFSQNWQYGVVPQLWVESRGSNANRFEYEPLYTSPSPAQPADTDLIAAVRSMAFDVDTDAVLNSGKVVSLQTLLEYLQSRPSTAKAGGTKCDEVISATPGTGGEGSGVGS